MKYFIYFSIIILIVSFSGCDSDSTIGLDSQIKRLSNAPVGVSYNNGSARVSINFSIPQAEQVKVYVQNILGDIIITLVNEELVAGFHSISWVAKNEKGETLKAGFYFITIKVNDVKLTSSFRIE